MEWFRLYHGTWSDPKLRVVAKRTGRTVAEVLACWISILDSASSGNPRGNASRMDFDSVEAHLGMADGSCRAIWAELIRRGMISQDGAIVAWTKRQPLRERETLDDSAGRVRAWRERNRGWGTVEKKSPEQEAASDEIPKPENGNDLPGLDTFFMLYPEGPRKVGLPDCLAYWVANNLEESATEIRDCLVAFKTTKQWRERGGDFIPEPINWLKKSPWLSFKAANPRQPGAVAAPVDAKKARKDAEKILADEEETEMAVVMAADPKEVIAIVHDVISKENDPVVRDRMRASGSLRSSRILRLRVIDALAKRRKG